MKKFLSILLGLFAHNWQLKLLALALAVLLYHTLKPAEGTRQKINNDRSFFQSR